jgi:hypothetical protein
MKYPEVTYDSPQLSAYRMHKSVQSSRMKLSKRAISYESIKAFEQELVKRGLLTKGEFYPLWFTAETERNTFLWKNGESLDDLENYEFWFDMPALIHKRLQSCIRDCTGSLLLTSDGEAPLNSSQEREKAYLLGLQNQYIKAGTHLHVISLVTYIACDEALEMLPDRTLILLPQS